MHHSFVDQFYPVVTLKQGRTEKKKSDVLLLSVALCTIAIASFVFLYGDMIDMVTNANLLLKSIFEGKFLSYYTYTLENSTSSFAANYDFPLYLIFAIWNLPFALIFHFEANGCVYLWFKLLVVLSILACSCLMYRIYRVFDEEDRFTRGSFLLLMLTSPLVFLGEFVAGQYDCISMILILAGLYEYLKGRDRRSLLFFCLAVPIKTFAVFLFIPLLVYKEKNIIRILLKTACGFIIPLSCRILFRGDPAYAFLLGSQNRDAVQLLTAASIKIYNVEVHVFLLLFLMLCFVCYFCRYDKSKVLLISASVYTAFILFIPIRSYWVFLAEPFLILLLTTKPRLYKVNFLIHTVAVISGSIFFLYYHNIYNTCLMARSFGLSRIWKLPDVVKYGSFSNFINVHGWAAYMPILRTVFTGSCIAFLVINAVDPKKMNLSSEFSPGVLSWIKGAVTAGVLGMMIFVEVYPCSLPAIDTLNYSASIIRPYKDYRDTEGDEEEDSSAEPEETEITVLPVFSEGQSANYYSADIVSGAVIEQPFDLADDRTVSEAYFQCYNTYPSRWSRVRVCLSIVDVNTQQVLTETIVGGSLITTGDIYIAKFKKISLCAGSYAIRITNIASSQERAGTSAPLYMMCNPDSQTARPAVIDGQEMEFPVCVCLN